jgi:dUTP pyrophosphatase
MQLFVQRRSENAYLPVRATSGSAGYDLFSASSGTIPAHQSGLIPTDISIAIPDGGYYARIAPRSGLALHKKLDVHGGVCDEDWRGPIGIIIFNHSESDFKYNKGDRVAQLILEKIATPPIVEVSELPKTERNENGFGSTGISTLPSFDTCVSSANTTSTNDVTSPAAKRHIQEIINQYIES